MSALETLRVIFDDARGMDLDAAMLTGEVMAAIDAVDAAAGNALAELDAAAVLSALLDRLTAPKRSVILQNRDRSTPAMISQMNAIAKMPDYYRVAPTKEFASGTPIVFGNDDSMPTHIAYGRKDKAVAADGRRFPVQYAVVEAADLLTSNTADGIANADYTNGVPGKLRAIAGNGRVAGLVAGFARGTAAEYVQELTEDDTTGVAPAVIGNFKSPVLVRIMQAGDVTENIGDISNQKGTSDLSPVEAAQNDAKRLDLGDVDVSDDGKPTESAALAFIAAMPEAERNNLMDGKQPGQRAYDRLMAATFWKAYEAPELVRLYAQSADTEIKTILGGMASAASELARLDGAGDLDIRGVVTEAASLAVNAKRQGVKLADFAKQTDMTLSPDTMAVVRLFADNIRSAKKIGERLRAAARYAYEEFTKEDSDMFGPVEKASRAEVLERLKNEPVQAVSMFDSVDPMRALELAGSLLEKTTALSESSDDPMAVLTLSGDILAIIAELENDTVPPDVLAARVIAAGVLGAKAFADGKPATPALNADIDPLLADLKVGEGIPILKAYTDAWMAANIAAPIAPAEPVTDEIMLSYIRIAADSIEELRRIDVYRMLSSIASDNIDGVTRAMLATWITAKRADLAAEVASVMAEEYPADSWTSIEPAASLAAPLPEGGALLPADAPAVATVALDVSAVSPQRADDLMFLADVAGEKVDMWDDALTDRIETIAAAHEGDSEVETAIKNAVTTYADFMTKAMSAPA